MKRDIRPQYREFQNGKTFRRNGLGNRATAGYEAVVDLALGAEIMLLAMEVNRSA